MAVVAAGSKVPDKTLLPLTPRTPVIEIPNQRDRSRYQPRPESRDQEIQNQHLSPLALQRESGQPTDIGSARRLQL